MATRKLLLSKELGIALGVGAGAVATQSQIDEMVKQHLKPISQEESPVPEEAELVAPYEVGNLPAGPQLEAKRRIGKSPLYYLKDGRAVSLIIPADKEAGQWQEIGSGVGDKVRWGLYNVDTQEGILTDAEHGTGLLWNGKPFNIGE